MVTRDEAIKTFFRTYPERIVDEVFETPENWIISGRDKVTGEELDVSPVAIDKIDGTVNEYFPPSHAGSMKAR